MTEEELIGEVKNIIDYCDDYLSNKVEPKYRDLALKIKEFSKEFLDECNRLKDMEPPTPEINEDPDEHFKHDCLQRAKDARSA